MLYTSQDLLEVKAMPGIAILQFNPHQLEEIITDKFPQVRVVTCSRYSTNVPVSSIINKIEVDSFRKVS